MAHSLGFIARHDLWSEDQKQRADEIKTQVEKQDIKLFRIAWADPHGASRAKTVTLPAFLSALEDGYNINVATTTLGASGARTFASFTQGGGMNLEEMTGSPNLIVVPDPSTFRILPWEPNVAWILGDEYFTSGKGFHFSPRRLLREQLPSATSTANGSAFRTRFWPVKIGVLLPRCVSTKHVKMRVYRTCWRRRADRGNFPGQEISRRKR
jgi:glutamine synthetase